MTNYGVNIGPVILYSGCPPRTLFYCPRLYYLKFSTQIFQYVKPTQRGQSLFLMKLIFFRWKRWKSSAKIVLNQHLSWIFLFSIRPDTHHTKRFFRDRLTFRLGNKTSVAEILTFIYSPSIKRTLWVLLSVFCDLYWTIVQVLKGPVVSCVPFLRRVHRENPNLTVLNMFRSFVYFFFQSPSKCSLEEQ